MKVAIVGSRNCENFDANQIMRHLPENCSQIISGGAQGVDRFAELAAKQAGIALVKYLPDYATYGRYAPLKRNEDIVDAADMVLAFWDYKSRGTAHAVAYCISKQVPVRIIGLENR